jgi:methylenetetrahydrofolate dehydrogenase (NADP+)/methenyltetrahydrofolate cyclohydrolase
LAAPLILDGKALAKVIEESLKGRVAAFNKKTGKIPTLAAILVGDDPASSTYVKMKGNACSRVGMDSKQVRLPETATTPELLDEIRRLNSDPRVNGVLLQHPVPRQIYERAAFEAIALEKDVDGVTCLGFGRMAMGEPAYGSATPAGIMRLIDHYQIPIEGKRVTIVGRSPILGKPMALMLLNRNATVTICHSKTQELSRVIGEADIVVGAVGKPKFIKGDWIKQGAVVIDAGYHPGGVGDVDLDVAMLRCSAYTPVPGGVGPMTIVTLIAQTMDAAEKQIREVVKPG